MLNYNGNKQERGLTLEEQLQVVRLLNELIIDAMADGDEISLLQRHLDWHKKMATKHEQDNK